MSDLGQSEIRDLSAAEASNTSSIQFEYEKETLLVAQLRHELAVSQKRQDAREKYEPRLFGLAVGWLVIALLVLVFQAYRIWGFSLASTVMVSVVGSTTLNVLGLLAIALKYIFPGSSKDG